MRTIKVIAMMMAAMAAMVAPAGDSAPFRLDTVVKTATSPMNDSLDVSYNAEWIGGDANATVVISDNGNEIKRAVGAGAFSYVLSGNGQHTLVYTTYIGGVAQDEVYSLPVWTTNGQIPVILNNADSTVVNHTIEAAGFADADVKDAIGGNVTKYNAFKEWAQGVNGGESAVVANTNVAAAFLLGAERLFENAPKIEFGEVAVGGGVGGTEGTKGTISLTVTVKDGEEAVKCAAEKVKDMFEATGDLGDWNGAAKMSPTVTVESGDGETMRFNVTPGDGTASKAFLRIKVK
jgi:hypothetical protein